MHCYFVHVSYSTETEFLMSSVFSISPARARATVPPPLASADDLVSHRMKECCVQLHASVQKWKEVCQKGFDVSTKLVNTLQYEKYVLSIILIIIFFMFMFYNFSDMCIRLVASLGHITLFLTLKLLRSERVCTVTSMMSNISWYECRLVA